MPAETLNCPMCGAAASTEATLLRTLRGATGHRGLPVVLWHDVRGGKFCSALRREGGTGRKSRGAKPELCPRCRVDMNAVVIGGSPLRECPHCEGIWADADALRQDLRGPGKAVGGAGDGAAAGGRRSAGVGGAEQIHYLPCPVCGELMNRVNFAHCSNVVVDVCSQHGTWFDHDDLRHIVEFIQAGGLEKARAREMEDLEEERRRVAWQSGEGRAWGPVCRRGRIMSCGTGDRGGGGAAAVADKVNFVERNEKSRVDPALRKRIQELIALKGRQNGGERGSGGGHHRQRAQVADGCQGPGRRAGDPHRGAGVALRLPALRPVPSDAQGDDLRVGADGAGQGGIPGGGGVRAADGGGGIHGDHRGGAGHHAGGARGRGAGNELWGEHPPAVGTIAESDN